jgi:exo-beta-1,3-glucanase (GH17 family)
LNPGVPTARETKGGDEELRSKLFGIRWVAYAPTNWDPESSPPLVPSDDSIRKDLQVLREAGFDGLITYGAGLTSIPKIAEQTDFQGLLQGVWNPNDPGEMQQAKKIAAGSGILVGIIVGNEGLMSRRYDLWSLQKAMEEMRRETGLPVSTTEIIESYYSKRELIDWSDFLAPNAHPFFHGRAMRDPVRAVEWTRRTFQEFGVEAGGKPVLFKEVGLPTAGDTGLSEKAQAQYYALLRQTEVKFAYFEAFNGPWKRGGAVEAHWGLFKADRSPKLAVRVITGKRRLQRE